MFDRLRIENFTAFRKAEFEFVPGINVLVGENATGKTHVMKLLYSMQMAQYDGTSEEQVLQNVFRPDTIEDLVHHGTRNRFARATAEWDGTAFPIKVDPVDFIRGARPVWQHVTRPAFIPVKDMLAHSVGFLSLFDQRYIDFDQIYRDILTLAFTPMLREGVRSDVEPLLQLLEERLEGRVELEGERFYLTSERGRLRINLVAEGLRKLALLYLLIANGSLSNGRVLYWDEPETNLNPSLMDEVVSILLELARRGTQIFLATHDYIILKELDLQRTETDWIRMFALERKRNASVAVHPAESYIDLRPNLIADQFHRLYSMEVGRALGGSNANRH